MIAFLFGFSLAYLMCTFAISGLGHLTRFSHLTQTLRAHAIVPARVVLPTAALLTVFELTVAAFALRALLRIRAAAIDLAVLGACVVAGVGFVLYLRRLLRTSRSSTCGCLPVRAPLTPLSLAPAGGVALLSAVGFVSALVLPQPAPAVLHQLGPAAQWLPPAWGLVLAGLVVLLPASMPHNVAVAPQ